MAFFWQKTRSSGRMVALELYINYLIRKQKVEPEHVEIYSLESGYKLRETNGYYQIVREVEND